MSHHQGEETVELVEVNPLSFWDSLRSPAVAVALAGAIGFTAIGATARAGSSVSRKAEAMSAIGFDSDFVLVNDPKRADGEAQAIDDAHGNLARVYLRYTNGSAEVKNTLPALCIAATAAYNHGLKFEIVTDGYFKPKLDLSTQKPAKGERFKPGYIPDTPGQKSRYLSMVANLMWGLAGNKNPDGTGGCLPQEKNITITPIKEFNYSGNPNAQQSTRLAAGLYKYIYTRLHREAEKPGLEVNLTLTGGDISTSSYNQPLKTIEDLATELDGQKGFDEFNFHIYANKNDMADPTASSAILKIEKVVDEVHTKFGAGMPISITELGGNSPTASDNEKQYSYKLPPGTMTFKGEGQANFYNKVITHAACIGIKQVVIFHMTDDQADKWRSGLRLPLGQYKSGANKVISTTDEALQGNAIDCAPTT